MTTETKPSPTYPEFCPITGRPFFMEMETADGDVYPTYGGPFDSYSIPELDEDGNYTVLHFDHDDDMRYEWETIYLEDIILFNQQSKKP